MKRICLAVWFMVTSSGPLFSAEVNGVDLRNCKIMLVFARIWKYSPLVEKERAVWIVMNSDGEYESIDWLDTPERRTTTWSGTLPDGIVALAHTHGDHLDPRPSFQDVSVARSLNISIYTLARKGIWKAAPDGQISKQADRGWFKKTAKTCGKWIGAVYE